MRQEACCGQAQQAAARAQQDVDAPFSDQFSLACSSYTAWRTFCGSGAPANETLTGPAAMAKSLDLQAALQARDFAAAQPILRLSRLPPDAEAQWRAYLLFHAGAAEAALEAYTGLAAAGGSKSYDLHRAACLFQLRRYREAMDAAMQGPECALRTRLLVHCGAKLDPAAAGNEGDHATGAAAPAGVPAGQQHAWEEQLGAGQLDDQLSLAALLHGRNDYDAAAAIYEGLLRQWPELHALRFYQALCCYMADDWQAASAHVDAYMAAHPDSVLAANLRACCEFRAGGAAAALHSLGSLPQQLPAKAEQQQHGALIRHNMVVFCEGQGGMQVLPPLLEAVPEARLNLVLHYCRRREPARALDLLRGLEPVTALEHICQGVAAALHGQVAGSEEIVRQAQRCFNAVGQSPTELDTVPGRQCAASALLLGGQPEEALPLLESILEVCEGDDALSWNLGTARAAAGQWEAAAQALQQVQSLHMLEDPGYAPLLARCLVRSGRAEEAWHLCVRAQQRSGAAPAVAQLLHLLGAESFSQGAYLWSARAFHTLEYMQQQGALAPVAAAGVWEGKRAAVAAALRQVAQGQAEAGTVVPELLAMLRGSANPQARVVAATVRQWAQEHVPDALALTRTGSWLSCWTLQYQCASVTGGD